MRLVPRVGDRPAGADMGVLDRVLLMSFLAGDFGFRMDRGRGEAALRGLLYMEVVERPSLLLEKVGLEDDLVRTKVEGLKKPLPKLSGLDLARLKSATGSTFSKSFTSRSSVAFRLLGEETGMAAVQLA